MRKWTSEEVDSHKEVDSDSCEEADSREVDSREEANHQLNNQALP